MTQTVFDYEFLENIADQVADETNGSIIANLDYCEGRVSLQVVDHIDNLVSTYTFIESPQIYSGMQELYNRQMEAYPTEEFLNEFAAMLGALKDHLLIETELQ